MEYMTLGDFLELTKDQDPGLPLMYFDDEWGQQPVNRIKTDPLVLDDKMIEVLGLIPAKYGGTKSDIPLYKVILVRGE